MNDHNEPLFSQEELDEDFEIATNMMIMGIQGKTPDYHEARAQMLRDRKEFN